MPSSNNAPLILKVVSPRSPTTFGKTVTTEKGKRAFAGTVVGGAARIVEVKGMELDAAFSPAMLYVNNLDKPGFIGALVGLLGEGGINIATFNLGRREARGDAAALVAVDGEVSPQVVDTLCKLEGVRKVVPLRF